MPFGMISGGLVEIVETGCFLDTGLASPAPWNELSYSTGVLFVVQVCAIYSESSRSRANRLPVSV